MVEVCTRFFNSLPMNTIWHRIKKYSVYFYAITHDALHFYALVECIVLSAFLIWFEIEKLKITSHQFVARLVCTIRIIANDSFVSNKGRREAAEKEFEMITWITAAPSQTVCVTDEMVLKFLFRSEAHYYAN